MLKPLPMPNNLGFATDMAVALLHERDGLFCVIMAQVIYVLLDEQMMHLAIAEAKRAREMGEVPVGAVIARDGKVIASAHNLVETQKDPTLHAEIVALRAAARAVGDWRLNGATLYVTLEPCPMCAGAILLARVSRLVFGAYDAQCGCAGSVYRITEDPAFAHFTPADGGVLKEACEQLLKRDRLNWRNHCS